MRELTEYPGPHQDDYANVLALNSAFIKATSDLKGPQRGRLAATPFLLFSLREDDTSWWRKALADDRQRDMIDSVELEDPLMRCVQAATLSFLWQLAQRNAYAVRVISGASIEWCEIVAELPLLTLLERMASRGDLIQSRLQIPDEIGQRLMGSGASSSMRLRRSSQLCALQTLLTRASTEPCARLPSAACNLSGPARALLKKV